MSAPAIGSTSRAWNEFFPADSAIDSAVRGRCQGSVRRFLSFAPAIAPLLLLAALSGCAGGGGAADDGSAGSPLPPPPPPSSNTAPVVTTGNAVVVRSGVRGMVYTVSATDADNDTLSYSVSGEDASSFAIDAATGALRFATPPSFNTPADTDGNNEYRITVAASDGKASGSLAISVRVVEDIPPGTMRNLTSPELSTEMSPGWNLGNSLEAIGGPVPWNSTTTNETAWGNPNTTQALISAVKAAGFKSIRMPVSWSEYADAGYNISPAWMAWVTEVVNYAQAAGLYTVINIHWDGGWMQPTYAQQAKANARITMFWTQIANNFRNYDDYLLFAGTNELMVRGPGLA